MRKTFLLKTGLIFLGITVPSSIPTLLINSFSIGLVSSIIFLTKKANFKFLTLLFFIYGLMVYLNLWSVNKIFIFVILTLLGSFFGYLVNKNNRIKLLLIILTLGYFLVAFIDGRPIRQQVKKEPVLENYIRDTNCYLKTYFLISKGMPYYQAYALAESGEASGDGYPGEIWGWKTPFLFYLWKLFPGSDGRSIYWLFTILVFSLPLTCYLISKKLVGKTYAVLAPFFVWPYFLLPLKESSFLQVEWWGLIFFLIGFYYLLKKNFLLTTIFFTLTLFSRELFVVHLFSLLVILFIKRQKKMLFSIIIPILSILLFYLTVHIPNVANFENLKNMNSWLRETNISSNFNSWPMVRTTLAYNSWQYLFYNLYLFRTSLLLSSLALLFLYFKRKSDKYFLLIASYLPFFLFQFKPGLTTLYHDYWGIYYVPLTLIAVPVVIKLLTNKT